MAKHVKKSVSPRTKSSRAPQKKKAKARVVAKAKSATRAKSAKAKSAGRAKTKGTVRAKPKAKPQSAGRMRQNRAAKGHRLSAATLPVNGTRVGVSDAERLRLLDEERTLVRDQENEAEDSALSESAEYIPGALEDDLAMEMGEAVVESATAGTQADEDIRDEEIPEEEGGPFVPTNARTEFAYDTDESNPEDAEPADFPTANRRLN